MWIGIATDRSPSTFPRQRQLLARTAIHTEKSDSLCHTHAAHTLFTLRLEQVSQTLGYLQMLLLRLNVIKLALCVCVFMRFVLS